MAQQMPDRLATASDEQLRRIVAFLDELPDRGEVDHLLDGVRPRLLALGLRRPLSFFRLLFLPLDPLIVAPGDWQQDPLRLPRNALVILGAVVLASLGREGEEMEQACRRMTTCDEEGLRALGGRLWSEAARLLPEAPPPGWSMVELGDDEYRGIAALCRRVWQHALAARRAAGATMAEDTDLQAALAGAAADGAASFDAVLTAMVAGCRRPALVLRAAATLAPAGAGQADVLLDLLLSGPPPWPLPRADIGRQMEAAVTAMEDLRDAVPVLRPDAIAAARQIEIDVVAQCRQAFRRTLDRALIQSLAVLDTAEEAEAVLPGLEREARALRRAALAVARLGEHDCADHACRQVGGLLRNMQQKAAPVLDEASIARLLGCLTGNLPQAASAAALSA